MMNMDMQARMDAVGARLARSDAELRAGLKNLAVEADLDVDMLLNPPVRVVCGLDGMVVAVEMDQKRRASMTGQEMAEAISRASKHPRFTVPPMDQGGSFEQRLAAMTAQARDVLAQAEAFTSSIETASSDQEVVGMNQARTVTATYQGPRLVGVECNPVWLSTASEAQIRDAVIEASHAALQTVRTLEHRR